MTGTIFDIKRFATHDGNGNKYIVVLMENGGRYVFNCKAVSDTQQKYNEILSRTGE